MPIQEIQQNHVEVPCLLVARKVACLLDHLHLTSPLDLISYSSCCCQGEQNIATAPYYQCFLFDIESAPLGKVVDVLLQVVEHLPSLRLILLEFWQ